MRQPLVSRGSLQEGTLIPPSAADHHGEDGRGRDVGRREATRAGRYLKCTLAGKINPTAKPGRERKKMGLSKFLYYTQHHPC